MGVRIRVQVTGADEAKASLQGHQQRIDGPIGPLLQAISAEAVSFFKERILKGSPQLPVLLTQTERIRAHYGHSGKPKLVRGGDLLRSIAPQGSTETSIAVGSALEFAYVLHEGGLVVDKRGRSHTVRPFRFLEPAEPLISDVETMVHDWFTPEAATA